MGTTVLSLHSRCGRIEQYLRLLTLNMSLFLTAQRKNAHSVLSTLVRYALRNERNMPGLAGIKIGHYRLREQLGRGGMSEIFPRRPPISIMLFRPRSSESFYGTWIKRHSAAIKQRRNWPRPIRLPSRFLRYRRRNRVLISMMVVLIMLLLVIVAVLILAILVSKG
jgi:hypothetical protein